MPGLRSEVTEDARTDLALQYAWYARAANIDVAERYLSAFRQTVELLVGRPEAGRLRRFRDPRLHDIRSFQLRGAFSAHLLFYRLEDELLVVFRVMHGMRDLPRRLVEPPG